MRGKHMAVAATNVDGRIIPAHAGQTSWPVSRTRVSPDHPRACGANDLTVSSLKPAAGSSPRMRGKLGEPHWKRRRSRIIPAHAGQTAGPAPPWRSSTDHPRACGANLAAALKIKQPSGSSPRMRGKRHGLRVGADHARIIPAHAGQTATQARELITAPDHPRACGANSPILCENS